MTVHSPFPGSLLHPKKAVKSSIFNDKNSVCTCIHGIEYKSTSKSIYKWLKKRKCGVRAGRGREMGWDGPGRGWGLGNDVVVWKKGGERFGEQDNSHI
jgi:hypothetical protein